MSQGLFIEIEPRPHLCYAISVGKSTLSCPEGHAKYFICRKDFYMKSVFISTVSGADSLGIIKSLAHTTRGVGGEWITSKVMKLEGHFCAMMKVTIDQDKEDALKKALRDEFPKLQFVHDALIEVTDKPSKTINLEIDCKDRPGLTKDINTILSDLDLTVENMEFNRFHVSTIGEAVFSAKLALAVSEDTSSEALAEEIETLSEDVRVNVI